MDRIAGAVAEADSGYPQGIVTNPYVPDATRAAEGSHTFSEA